MDRLKPWWKAFKNLAIVFSFVVNLALVTVLLAVAEPGLWFAMDLKTKVLQPTLANLDNAIQGLSRAQLHTTMEVSAPLPVSFNLPLDQQVPVAFTLPLDQAMPVAFDLSIEQDTAVVLQQAVPLRLPAQFVLAGGGGAFNGSVSFTLPAGLVLPVRLSLTVPVSQTIPLRMDIPVSASIPLKMDVPVRETIPLRMNVPVDLALGPAGLDPAVEALRSTLRPLRDAVAQMPDEDDLPWLKPFLGQ
ncbi:MAG: hypothetical protein GXY76_08130 [Chloroflexi bacterium]|nr:hypothetical protein [Chloroflexota bacterium]